MLTNNTNKEGDIKSISFKNKLNSESSKIYNGIREQYKKIDYTKLVRNGPGKHHYNFTILSLGNLMKIFIYHYKFFR